jgi:hypothetical protein
MARDSSGNHTLPAGNPVVGGTTISSTVHNNTTSDISTELTDSLSRSGKGGMLAALRSYDGTITAPGVAFSSETGTGVYRAGAADARLAIGGADIQKWTASGIFAGLLQAITAAAISVKGAVADGAAAVGVILDNTVALSTSGAKCLSVRNNGTEKLAVDKDGVVLGAAAGATLALKGTTADGASAVGVALDNTVALANAGAKALSVRVNAVEKAYVNKDGKGYFVGLDAGSAVISNVATAVASTDAVNLSQLQGTTWTKSTVTSLQSTDNTGPISTSLSFTASTSTKYHMRGQLLVYTSTNTPNILFNITVPAGATMNWLSGIGGVTYANPAAATAAATIAFSTDGNHRLITFFADVVTAGTGGTVDLQFDSSSADVVHIAVGSWMEYSSHA